MGCTGSYYRYQFQGPIEDYPLALAAATEWNRCPAIYADVRLEPTDESIAIIYVPTLNVSGFAGPAAIEYQHVPHTQALIAHEMGHTFGLQHYGNGLMNASMLQFHVTDEDCRKLEER